MDSRRTDKRAPRRASRRRAGFTLVELLTVVAIITLLIGILIPALSRAREHARASATRAILQSIGAGLDMFKNENPEECRGGEGYPSSALRDDPTIPNEQDFFGAQWVVRFLLGKTLDGYVPRKNVPRSILSHPDAAPYYEEAHWYGEDEDDPYLDRAGPYLNSEQLVLAKLWEIEGSPFVAPDPNDQNDPLVVENQPVILDQFDFPILYYSANTRLYRKMKATAPIAGAYDAIETPEASGIYSHADNALFTGLSVGGTEEFPAWEFYDVKTVSTPKLMEFGNWSGADGLPTEPDDFNQSENTHTFPNYILNEEAFEKSNGKTLAPYRPDSFLLITPGPDGTYGSEDDVTNFR